MSRKLIVWILFSVTAIVLSACGGPAANNGANKPANASNSSATAPAANAAAIETDIKKAVNDMAAALLKGDAAYFEKLYTEKYMFVGPDGAVATGAERLASMKSGGTKYDSIKYEDITVRTDAEGSGAVSISKATVKGVNLGRPVDGQFRVTHVWSKTKDGWRLASGQTTPITAAAAPAANSAANSNAAAPAATSKTNSNAGK